MAAGAHRRACPEGTLPGSWGPPRPGAPLPTFARVTPLPHWAGIS